MYCDLLITVHKCAETIQGRKLYEEIRYLGKSFFSLTKGQLISKANQQAGDSPKKRTKTHRTVVKTNSFVRFLGESSA